MTSFRDAPTLSSRLTWLDGAGPTAPVDAASPPVDHEDFGGWSLVALGPRLPSTRTDDAVDAWIWEKKEQPGALWLGLGATSPPSLFVRAESPAALGGLLDRFFTAPAPKKERTRSHDVFLGLFPTMREIENRLALDVFTCTLPLRLGTAATDEHPDPESVETELVLLTTFLTRHSESRIDLAGWHGEMVGVDARIVTAHLSYAPAADAEVIRRFNAAHETTFPEDIPIDLVGAFFDMVNFDPARLEKEVESGAEPTFMLAVLALVLAHDPPRAEAALKRWAEHPDPQRSTLAKQLLESVADGTLSVE